MNNERRDASRRPARIESASGSAAARKRPCRRRIERRLRSRRRRTCVLRNGRRLCRTLRRRPGFPSPASCAVRRRSLRGNGLLWRRFLRNGAHRRRTRRLVLQVRSVGLALITEHLFRGKAVMPDVGAHGVERLLHLLQTRLQGSRRAAPGGLVLFSYRHVFMLHVALQFASLACAAPLSPRSPHANPAIQRRYLR
ncbi:hypothetical protein SAMN05421548_11274 [Paraburkholderia lycopersici]|uniref:Uncharacterized protein n=1 Tax=Paraburkholderia lycopersici TaxID=416944 RepID=A0A1G6QR18_9BURK|nr:hypothetical protein SAMN05421548_11274 [Paraburkholderia lycopersici]